MKKRLRLKRLRPTERLVVSGCRLYATRPLEADGRDSFEPVARSLLTLNLVFLFDAWTRVGPGRLRGRWVKDVAVAELTIRDSQLEGAGTVTWSRERAGSEEAITEPFRLRCPLPTSRLGIRRARPLVLLAAGAQAVAAA